MENIDFRKNTLLEVKNLKCYFNDSKRIFKKNNRVIKAVDGLSFKINKGEVYGLVGESGCGKSTTGRAILNLIPKVGGALSFDGNLIYDVENKYSISGKKMKKTRKDMQMIFQDPYASLNPRLTVGDIIGEPLDIYKLCKGKEREEKIKYFLDKVGLDRNHINRYPHEFSGGQRQRIGIARALVLDPKLIVCDEPVSALDVSIQSSVLNLLKRLQNDFQLSYLFIAHDLSVVRYIADRIGVMYLGQLVETADTDDLFKNPLHPYTESLLSAIPSPTPGVKKERIILKGDVPSPLNPPSGCVFHTRCPKAMDICKAVVPERIQMGEGHEVQCHLYN